MLRLMPFSRGSGQSTNGVLKNEAMGGTEVTAIPVSLATTRVRATSRLSGRAVERQSGSAVTTELAGIPGPKYSAQALQTSLSLLFIQVIEPLMFVARPAACGVLRLGTHPAGCKTLWPRPPRCAKLKSRGPFCFVCCKRGKITIDKRGCLSPVSALPFQEAPEQNHVLPVSNTLSQDLKNLCGW